MTSPNRNKRKRPYSLKNRCFESLVALAPAATEQTALQTGLQNTLAETITLTEAQSGSLFLVDKNLIGARMILPSDQADNGQFTADNGIVEWIVRHCEPVNITDIRHDQRWQSGKDVDVHIRSALAVPLVDRSDEVLGVLSLHHSRLAHFTPLHNDLMQVAANQMALVVHSARMFHKQRLLTDRQIITFKLLRAVGESLKPEEVAYIAVETVAELTGWPTVVISTPDADGERLIIQASIGILSIDEGVNGRAFRTGDTQISPDLTSGLNWVGDFTALAVPLRRGRHKLGVFNVEVDRPNGFSGEDILLAESLAEAIVLALDNARLYAETRQRLREQTILREAGALMASTLDLPTLLSYIAEQMGRIIDTTSVYICSYDVDEMTATVLAEYFSPEATAQEQISDLGATYYLPDDLPGTAVFLEAGQPKVITVEELDFARSKHAYRREYQAQTILLIPLQVGGQTMAYAELWESRRRRSFTADEMSLCQTIAQQAAIAMENARLFQTVQGEQGRLRALIESDRDGIVLVGMDGDILILNQPVLDFLGLNGRPWDWINRPMVAILLELRRAAPNVVRAMMVEMRRLQNGDESVEEAEIEIDSRAIHWRNLPVLSGDDLVGRLLVLRDVTEERLLERMRDDLIHTMVHDLRGPLTSISVSLHLLDVLTDPANDRERETLNRANKSMDRVLELVNAILDISRLESGRMALNYASVSLTDLIHNVLEWQFPLIDDKRLQLELALTDSLPDTWSDEELMERVLQNLIGNAIKFTPNGGCITITAVADKDDRLLVSISDTGQGIPPEIRGRLFQKFTKGGQVEGGSGLGLYFCKMVLEAHGERIWVGGTSGAGTTFHFTLPTA